MLGYGQIIHEEDYIPMNLSTISKGLIITLFFLTLYKEDLCEEENLTTLTKFVLNASLQSQAFCV